MTRLRPAVLPGLLAVLCLAQATARAEHYAILFAGGVDAANNDDRFYEVTWDMYFRTRDFLNFLPENIYVIAFDGTNAGVDRASGVSSDWTNILASGSTVQEATAANLLATIQGLGAAERDTFLFWAYDHGSGTEGDRNAFDEEELCGWGEDIGDSQFASQVSAANLGAGRQAFVFCQCFAGGMLDNLACATTPGRFGCAASSHFEPALWNPLATAPHGFSDAFVEGIESRITSTHDLYNYAYSQTPQAIGEGPDATYSPGFQHPWMEGADYELAVAEWTGADDNTWGSILNWDFGVQPTADRTVRILAPERAILLGETDAARVLILQSAAELEVGASSQLDVGLDVVNDGGALLVSATGTLAVQGEFLNRDALAELSVATNGEVTARRLENRGSLDIEGSLSLTEDLVNKGQMTVGGLADVGEAFTNTGSTTVEAGGTLQTGLIHDVTVQALSSLRIEDSGSTVHPGYDLIADGTVHVLSGGLLHVGNIAYMGRDTVQPGGARLSLTDATLDVDNQLLIGVNHQAHVEATGSVLGVHSLVSVGNAAPGTLELAGGELTAMYLHVGDDSSGQLTLLTEGGAGPKIKMDGSRQIVVGVAAYGQVDHHAGSIDRSDADGDYPSLYLGYDAEGEGVYTLKDGTIHAHYLGLGRNGTGTFHQDGGTVRADYLLRFASGAGSSGTYNLNAGTLEVAQIGDGAGAGMLNIGAGRLDLTGTVLVVDTLRIGVGTTGKLDLMSKYVTVDNLRIGAGAEGAFSMDGGTTTVSQALSVGYTASGRLRQVAGDVVADDVIVGHGSSTMGIYHLDGGTLTAAGDLLLGYYGSSSFVQRPGTTVAADSIDVGHGNGSWNNGYRQEGGLLNVAQQLHIACHTSGDGQFDLLGGKLLTAGTVVGEAGLGTFTQDGGAHDVSGDLYVGTAGSGSSYTLDGATSRVSSTNTYVGHDATATFTQDDGLHTIAQDLYLGCNPGSHGIYQLNGGVLDVGADIHVGYNGGTGELLMGGGTLIGPPHSLRIAPTTGRVAGWGTLDTAVKNGGELAADGGCLTILHAYSGGGSIDIASGAALELHDHAELAGPVTLAGTLRIRGGTTELSGAVSGDAASRVEIDAPAELRILADVSAGTLHTSGAVRHMSGSTILVGALEVPGSYTLGPGCELTEPLALVEGKFTHGGGRHVADELFIGSPTGFAAYAISGGELEVGSLHVGTTSAGRPGPGALIVTDPSAAITVTDDFTISALGHLKLAPGTTIHMTGSQFLNHSTDPVAVGSLVNLNLVFEGGPAVVDAFEVGGADWGLSDQGFIDNFALGMLTVGGAHIGQLRLLDGFDNQPDWDGPEMLHVRGLHVGAGSLLDLNGLRLVYDEATIHPEATILLNGGTLTQTPEPASLLLLAGGLAALLRRRMRGRQALARNGDSW